MVLVRRKADGLFNTNKTGRRSFYRKQHWSNNPNECKPFANEAGARWAFYHYIPRDPTCKCGRKESKYKPGLFYTDTNFNCEHEKTRKAKVREYFDERYEIVPIKVEIKV